MIKIAITGGRDHVATPQEIIKFFEYINYISGKHLITRDRLTILHGGARGVDTDISEICYQLDFLVIPFLADWSKYGKKAGHQRNGVMLEEGGANYLIAFPGGTGTADCVRQARSMNIIVFYIRDEGKL